MAIATKKCTPPSLSSETTTELRFLLNLPSEQRVQFLVILLRRAKKKRSIFIDELLDSAGLFYELNRDEYTPEKLLQFGWDLNAADTIIYRQSN